MKESQYGRPGGLFIGTILIGKYTGTEFALLGAGSLSPFFYPSGVSSTAHKRTRSHKGCTFRHGLPTERARDYPAFTAEMQKDIMDTLQKRKQERREKTALDSRLIYIIGTVCQGKYAGTQFSFVRLKNTPAFFNPHNVSRVINGVMNTYYGCQFRKATFEEAHPFHHCFTPEMADDLRMIFKPSTHVYAIPVKGKYKGVKFLLRGNKEMVRFFSPPAVYKVLTGRNKVHLGFTFVQARPDDSLVDINTQLELSLFYEIQDELNTFFICTIQKGPFVGLEIGFTSRRVARRYFQASSLNNVLSGKTRQYKKCLFRKASYEEALARVSNLTPEVAEYLL